MRASDRGAPPSSADVDVELDVVDRNNKPPIWDMTTYGPVHIKENVTVGTVVTSVKARLVYGSGHPPAALLNTTNDVVLSVSIDSFDSEKRTSWRLWLKTRASRPCPEPWRSR